MHLLKEVVGVKRGLAPVRRSCDRLTVPEVLDIARSEDAGYGSLPTRIDFDFAKFGYSNRPDMAMRALAFDRATLAYLRDHPKATVVADAYDCVLIDTQGAIGPLQDAAVMAADGESTTLAAGNYRACARPVQWGGTDAAASACRTFTVA